MLGNVTTYQLFTKERMDQYLDEAARDRMARAAVRAGGERRPATGRGAVAGLLTGLGTLLRAGGRRNADRTPMHGLTGDRGPSRCP